MMTTQARTEYGLLYEATNRRTLCGEQKLVQAQRYHARRVADHEANLRDPEWIARNQNYRWAMEGPNRTPDWEAVRNHKEMECRREELALFGTAGAVAGTYVDNCDVPIRLRARITYRAWRANNALKRTLRRLGRGIQWWADQ